MSVNRITLIFSMSFLLVARLAFSQTTESSERTKLEKEKKENIQKIQEAQEILAETSDRRKSSLGQLHAINQQIEARETLIKSINNEITLLNNQIGEIQDIIEALETDLIDLKEEYAAMVYAGSKAGSSYDRLIFIFSAKTFNQLFMRIKYMEQYGNVREKQLSQIERVRQTLSGQKSSVEDKKGERETLLQDQLSANKELLVLKQKQNLVVQDLTKQEKDLKKELLLREEAVKKLDNLIANLIEREIKESSKGKSTNTITLEGEAKEISALFEKTKSNLSWPVNTGFISKQFGRHPHPVMRNIMEDNNGVDIQTSKDAQVQAVFEGVVKTIAAVPGMNKVVITQHGDYFTLYARLKEVYVKKGQAIKPEEPIGSVYTDVDGVSTLHFEIWRNNEKLNPQAWLSRK